MNVLFMLKDESGSTVIKYSLMAALIVASAVIGANLKNIAELF